MKPCSSALAAHMGGTLTTLAELVKITRTDGVVIAMTSHDCDLIVDGVTYRADASFTAQSALTADAALRAKDFDITGALDSTLIDADDIRAGLYDHARIDVMLCNWADVSQGVMHMRRGWLGEVVMQEDQYVAALRGMQDLLTRKVGETYTPECRHDLGDGRCRVNCTALAVSGTVSMAEDTRSFTDYTRGEASDYFAHGTLTWTSGANAGHRQEIAAWDALAQRMTLWLAPPNAMSVGDTYSAIPGCDKRFSTCREKFTNGVNYGGFPHLPGLGKLLEVGG